jgi:hypothetical protein
MPAVHTRILIDGGVMHLIFIIQISQLLPPPASFAASAAAAAAAKALISKIDQWL